MLRFESVKICSVHPRANRISSDCSVRLPTQVIFEVSLIREAPSLAGTQSMQHCRIEVD